MRKYLIAVVAALTALAFATVALAQDDAASMTVKASPKKAGSKHHPKNEKLRLQVVNNDTNRTMSDLDITLPKTLELSGKGFKKCSADTLDNETKSACPKAAKVGTGTAKAILGVNNPPEKPKQDLTFDVTAYTDGAKKINFYLEGIVNVTAPGKIKKKKGHQVLHIDVPEVAQSPDGGFTFAGLVSLDTTLKGKVHKHKLVASTGCKHHKHPFSTVLTFIDNGVSEAGTVTTDGSAKCR